MSNLCYFTTLSPLKKKTGRMKRKYFKLPVLKSVSFIKFATKKLNDCFLKV